MYTILNEAGPRNEHYQNEFLRESGLKVQTYEQGYSSSVAGISTGDWAIDFPHPVAPKVHVSSLRMYVDFL